MPRYHTLDVSREQIAQVMDDFYARVQQHPKHIDNNKHI